VSLALASLFTLALNLVPFLIMFVVLERELPPWTILLLPVVVAPLWFLSLALAFLLASVSAYFRDLQQVVPLINTAVLFVSPIFFPTSRLPPRVQELSRWFSPLVEPLEASKELIFIGTIPAWQPMFWYSLVAAVLFAVGWKLYGFASRGFGDVV